MSSFSPLTAVMLVAILCVASSIITTEAQNTASCAQKLIPCGQYLNTTATPPDTCCSSIKEAVANELDCLCNLYNTPGLLATFNVNVTQAIALTRRCGVNADLTACGNSTAEGPSAAATPPPGVAGNDGSRVAWTGISCLLLLWAAFLFY